MKVYIKSRKRKKSQFQFYMQQFVEAATKQGIISKGAVWFELLFNLNAMVQRLSRLRVKKRNSKGKKPAGEKVGTIVAPGNGGTFRKLTLLPYPYFRNKGKKKAIIVTSRGEALFKNAFPFFYNYEVIPMLWDVWPNSWDSLFRDLKLFKCKTVFVTVQAVAEKITRELGIQAYWIPEGIDPTGYHKGRELRDRTIEVYELGRQQKEYHVVLEKLHQRGVIKEYCRNVYNEAGGLQSLAFPTADDLLKNLPNIKIVVSFPQVDTHPEKAGGLDTLTQRYWEAMLSRCIIVGRAPGELIELIGYDPVINVDWKNPEKQMEMILNNLEEYQALVDRNYAVALEKAPWSSRIADLIKILNDEGYTL